VIRIVPFRSVAEAARRLRFLGVAEADLPPLEAGLRPFLAYVPAGFPRGEEVVAAAARRGCAAAAARGGWVTTLSSPGQVAAWIREEGEDAPLLAALQAALERWLARAFRVEWADRHLLLGEEPVIMGILNVTPDSFYDGGRWFDPAAAVRRGIEMAEEGAAIIDVGGESTRPGSAGVPPEEQIRRVVPVIEALAARTRAVLSVDTTSAAVARAAAAAGARIINDTSALRDDPGMAEVARESGCAVVLMHRKGTPATMQIRPHYDSLFADLLAFFEERIEAAVRAGIPRERLLVDPGIGFGKRLEDNLALHRCLGELRNLGLPIVFGPSRKSFLGLLTGRPPQDRAFATAASVTWAVAEGAHVLRVHDVSAMRDAALVARAIREGPEC